ncbi:DNA translocase FtsK [Persicimonas caeni]|nr:DNA translocase FtsK [Persicimonas caeni]
MAAESTSTKNSTGKSPALWREIGGLVLVALALVILLSILSFDPADLEAAGAPGNLIGPVGVRVGDALLYLFGVGSFFFDALLWYLGFMLIVGRLIEWKWSEIGGQLLFVLSGAMLSHLFFVDYTLFGHMPGGLVGEFTGEVMRGLFGTVGTSIIGVCSLLLSLMLATDMSLGALVRKIMGGVHRFGAWMKHKREVRRLYKERVAEERRKILEQAAKEGKDPAQIAAELSVKPLVEGDYEFDAEKEVEEKLSKKLMNLFKGEIDEDFDEASTTAPDSSSDEADDDDWEMGEPMATDPEIEDEDVADVDDEEEEADEGPEIVIRHVDEDDDEDDATEQNAGDVIDMGAEKKASGPVNADFGPQIVESEAQKKAKAKKDLLAGDDEDGVLFKPKKKGKYELPPLSFLDYDDSDGVDVDTEALRSMAAQIEQTLSDFKVEGQIVEICPGPVITMFEFSPAPGVKISKIARLSDDLAMALAAYSVRIVAPIPGKGVVGIEVPNPTREMVWLKEIIADDVFQGNEMQLPMALGKGTEGEPVTADLAKMPHLLVAGATGSGKSVAVNTMIVSLLYMNSPEDVRMIMVDPKMLEFNIYEDIPHLLLPVVTDPKQATVALNWVVNEMEQRYQKLADLGVRNLKGYNKKVERLTKQAELDHLDGKEESAAMRELDIDHNGKATHERMPYLVVVIDEFADLMMTASKDVEQAVARLAQKARAAGIHVILATQRPSTDVITGLIKANFPTRMALRVTSKTDSRVILDSNGAENLLGNGDMLFVPPGTSNLKRVHGAFVSENEIHQIVDFLKEQGDPQYDESILVEEDEEEESPLEQEWEKDEYYDDAVKVVVDSGKASISMIQRKLRVGYNRAARMVDRMAAEGIVGESDGCRPREVLVDTVPDHCK